jgi:hypothetical protein
MQGVVKDIFSFDLEDSASRRRTLNNRLKFVISMLLVVIFCRAAFGIDVLRDPLASDLFIDPAHGNDSNAGDEAHPLLTLTAAIPLMNAGRTIWIKNGTVTMPLVLTAPAGTAGAHCTVAAYPGQTAILNSESKLFAGTSYWDFRNLGISCEKSGIILGTDYQNTAPPSDHIRFINCRGTKSFSGYTDNTGIIIAYPGTDYLEIIGGSYVGSGSTGLSNSSLLFFDRTRHVKVDGVFIDNSEIPFYYKHDHGATSSDQVDIQIINCIIARSRRGFQSDCCWIKIQNNLFYECGISLGTGSPTHGGRYDELRHNTFVDSGIEMGISGGWARMYNILRDNVFTGTGQVFDNAYGDMNNLDLETDADYNAFDGSRIVYWRNNQTYTLTAYKIAYPDQEVHSVSGPILFSGGTYPDYKVPSQWKLAPGSVGIGNASDGTDRGIDVSRVCSGDLSTSSSTVPQKPQALHVR